jgi:hypothetical protein
VYCPLELHGRRIHVGGGKDGAGGVPGRAARLASPMAVGERGFGAVAWGGGRVVASGGRGRVRRAGKNGRGLGGGGREGAAAPVEWGGAAAPVI